ncbi:sigma-54-dependent Fis family transcriptional regulator [Desulfovibrio oxyclinae]|uniref:sigma-54-dependent Fis family transcriptional regulator n=1 Tax=Desulfovibrio oxyclinae TaxID=63560 RepID=UPI000361F9B0|nr:sigma-54-dependent Fis family transcriptional regulator [Desulfovibrio oxyclinae]
MHTPIRKLKLSALLAICQVIDRALDLERTLGDILRILSEKLAMQRATVTLLDQHTGLLNISASYGLRPEEERRGVYRLDEGVTGRIFQTAQPYYVPDVSREPLFLDKTGTRAVQKNTLSFLGVPILLGGSPIGVLNVDRLFTDDVDFGEDMEFLSVVATLIAQFISLNEKVKKREEVLRAENVQLRSQLSRENKGPYIVGRSHAMQEVQRQLERVAPTRATVLLLGESGVGKTLIARIIHELSDRKSYPFIKVNCASIPENLLESELFGYEKGAFTGAANTRPGRFEEACGGTIFLDEIGELAMPVQAKLLRVLQEKEFERLGSSRTRSVDVRIVTATNRDLEQLAAQGNFRPDLFYRLSVFPMTVPPLRERKEDVPGLLSHFIKKAEEDYGRTLSLTPRALNLLTEYDWPGNVREMENLIERLVIMADQERLDHDFIRSFLTPATHAPEPVPVPEPDLHASPVHAEHCGGMGSLADMERNEVIAALRRADWIQYRAAEELGITPRQMGYRVHKYGLESMIAEGRAELRRHK